MTVDARDEGELTKLHDRAAQEIAVYRRLRELVVSDALTLPVSPEDKDSADAAVKTVPFEVPERREAMTWHERNDRDPAHT